MGWYLLMDYILYKLMGWLVFIVWFIRVWFEVIFNDIWKGLRSELDIN